VPVRSRATIAASPCMIRLYEEIYYHEYATRLGSVHGFFLMLAAVPQILTLTRGLRRWAETGTIWRFNESTSLAEKTSTWGR
jgi:hypothetical protein